MVATATTTIMSHKRRLSILFVSCCWLAGTAAGFQSLSSTPKRSLICRSAKKASTKKTATAPSSSSSRQNRIPALLEWAEKVAEIQWSKQALTLGDTPGAGLGFVAQKAVEANQVLLQVPDTAALTIEAPNGGPNDNGKLSKACRSSGVSLKDIPWYAQFSMYLYMLKQGNSDLDRTPWLESLPASFDTPLHWSVEQRSEWLQYDSMVKSVERQERKWNRLYQTVQRVMPQMTWEEFCWGCETARSRAFSGSTAGKFNPGIYAFTLLLVTIYVGLGLGTLEQAANGAGVVFSASVLKDFVLPKFFKSKVYVICPVIDMANHNSVMCNAQVSLEYFANAYSLATTRPISANQPVEISYGNDRSNDQLLQYYGFLEPNNPADVYVMPPLREWPLQAMEEATGRSVSGGRLEKLNKAGLLGSVISEKDTDDDDDGGNNPWGGVVLTRTGGIDPAVLSALRALFSTDEEWAAAGEAVGNFAESVSAANEQAALLAAKTAIQLELEGKATTLQEDLDQIKRVDQGLDKMTDAEELMAIRFRVEKKKLLMDSMAKL